MNNEKKLVSNKYMYTYFDKFEIFMTFHLCVTFMIFSIIKKFILIMKKTGKVDISQVCCDISTNLLIHCLKKIYDKITQNLIDCDIRTVDSA